MAKRYDVVAVTGSYQKDGMDKAKYQNVGYILEKDGKFYLKLNHLVTVHDDGHVINFFNMFEPQQSQQSRPSQSAQTRQAQSQPASTRDNFEDQDIPF